MAIDTIRKLVVRRKTVRALHVLDDKDLVRAHGGAESAVPGEAESGNIYCPASAAGPTATGG